MPEIWRLIFHRRSGVHVARPLALGPIGATLYHPPSNANAQPTVGSHQSPCNIMPAITVPIIYCGNAYIVGPMAYMYMYRMMYVLLNTFLGSRLY